jgi:hypothetical protein
MLAVGPIFHDLHPRQGAEESRPTEEAAAQAELAEDGRAMNSARDSAVIASDFELWEEELHNHGQHCKTAWCLLKMKRGEHLADWWCHAPCGRIAPVCEARRQHARQQGSAWCRGCKMRHPYAQIGWWPITNG